MRKELLQSLKPVVGIDSCQLTSNLRSTLIVGIKKITKESLVGEQKQKSSKTQSGPTKKRPEDDFLIVGVGASAGGIQMYRDGETLRLIEQAHRIT